MLNPEQYLCTRCHKWKDLSCYSHRKSGKRLKTCDSCREARAARGYSARGGSSQQRNPPERECLGDGNPYRLALQKPWSEIAEFTQGGNN